MLPGVLPWKKPRPDRWLIKQAGSACPAVASLLADAALCLVEISEIQAVSLLMGSRLEIGGKFYQASAGGQLITRQLPNESRTVNKLWEHLRDNHGIDATHLRFDPVGNIKKCWRVRKVATLKKN